MALVEVSQQQGRVPVTVFHIQDRINLGNYKELEGAAQTAHEGGTRNLVIDLTKSESLTSIGIRAIVAIHKIMAAGNGGGIKLAGVIQPIQDMLQIAGITQFIQIHGTVDEAVASF